MLWRACRIQSWPACLWIAPRELLVLICLHMSGGESNLATFAALEAGRLGLRSARQFEDGKRAAISVAACNAH